MSHASVIIATHNRADLLPRAVKSAQAAGHEVEIIVVDDASTDNTAQVCQSLNNVKYLRADRNLGVAGARNLGILAAKGKYITFLDDDDIRLAGSLDHQIEILEHEPPAAMVYGRAIVGDQDGCPTDRLYPEKCPQGDLFWALVGQNLIPCGGAVFRRDSLMQVGLLDPKAAGIEDWDLWVRLSEVFPIVARDSPVFIWRRSKPGSGQYCSNYRRILQLSIRQFRKVWMDLPRAVSAGPTQRRDAWHRFSENLTIQLLWESARALGQGELFEPGKSLSIIPQLHPWTFLKVVGRYAFRIPTVLSTSGAHRAWHLIRD
jgi:glycosyltransferase involved in cell wall biosynthesis